ncbi:MAG: hypothetical protein Q8L14_30320 [Myxococcales bacterium]|nr:hypothetical protein [Myxococcales bacterium]
MRRAWWLGVLLVACDFDAAYERRCDAGLCASSGGGLSGGQGGGSMAGGQGGGATAGGQGGGASCPTPLTLELNVVTRSPISATACVHLDIALKCQGVRIDAGVPIDLRVNNRSNALNRPATLFSNSTCSNAPPFGFTTGDVYFNSKVAGQIHMFGSYEIVVDAGVSASRLVHLEPQIAGSIAMVLLPINTCLSLPPISFIGSNDAGPVLAPGPQKFTGTLTGPLMPCGPTEVFVGGEESASSVTPQVMATRPETSSSGIMLYGDAGQVSYLVRPCVNDGGIVSMAPLCCQPSGTSLLDSGVICL